MSIFGKILEKLGSKVPITFLPLPTDDPKQRKPDISLAKKLLGWEPQVSFDEGIGRTVTYFRDFLGIHA